MLFAVVHSSTAYIISEVHVCKNHALINKRFRGKIDKINKKKKKKKKKRKKNLR